MRKRAWLAPTFSIIQRLFMISSSLGRSLLPLTSATLHTWYSIMYTSKLPLTTLPINRMWPASK